MNKKNFAAKVRAEVSERLGDQFTVTLKEIVKNNGVAMQGMLIYSREQNVAPTIYLDPFWERYEQGEEWDTIIARILSVYESNVPCDPLDMTFYMDFEKVKKRIVYKLINAERNEKLLGTIPHICFLDLAICFCYAFSHKSLGNGTILVNNSQMKVWNTNTVELLRLAQKNTRRLFGMDMQPMERILEQLLREELDGDAAEGKALVISTIPMNVLSNRRRQYGAAAMLYPGVLQTIADSLEASLYILPSSVHEVIIMPDTGQEDPDFLKEMVAEVNATQVLPEEILSGSVYYYDREKREVTVL